MLLSAIISPAYATGCANESKASSDDKGDTAAVEDDDTSESGGETTAADDSEPSAAIDFDEFESVQFLELDDGIVYAIWQDRSVGNNDVFFAKSEDGGDL